jgi:hypothetical protein
MILVMPLPQPGDLTSLVLRTDFADDAAWEALKAALGPDEATFVSDPFYADVPVAVLVAADAAAPESESVFQVFLADGVALADHRLLAVDLFDEPGRTFRVAAEWFGEVSANFSIANLEFADFADVVDPSGTFRGWDQAPDVVGEDPARSARG